MTDARQHTEAAPGSPEFWEGFYRARPQVFSGNVNVVLARAVEPLRPGTALDLGAGEGGDTAWLAERGWAVTAVDVSATALARVAERVDGLPVALARHDLTATFPAGTLDLDPAAWDVERCETVDRVVTRPDGAEMSVPDEIVQVRRR